MRDVPGSRVRLLGPERGHQSPGLGVSGLGEEPVRDGRATGEVLGNPAADQAIGPFLNPVEQGLIDEICVIYRVAYGPYADLSWTRGSVQSSRSPLSMAR